MRCPSVEDPKIIAMSYARYFHDESSLQAGVPRRILFPTSLEDLSSAISEMASQNESLTISGARTGIVGGAVARGGESLLSLEKMISPPLVIFSDRFQAWTATVTPGVTLNALRAHLKETPGFHLFPVDPTDGRASLGGMVATNASGA